MQKHERDCLAAARAASKSMGVTVVIEDGHGPKKRLVMTGPGGKLFKVVSSSPRDRESEVYFARRWAKAAARQLA